MSDETPILRPLTPEACAAVGGKDVPLSRFPFRVGRESRLGVVHGALRVIERRKLDHPPNNELYLIDEGRPLQVSREHFQIERLPDGGYELVDRDSACGTIVGNQAVGGGDGGGRCRLEDDNVIVVGMESSPYAFKFVIPGSAVPG
jgi:hypothetical protein